MTAIQNIAFKYKEELKKDNYFLLYDGFTEETGVDLGIGFKNQHQFSHCFTKKKTQCEPKLLDYVARKIGDKNKNILISSEMLSQIDDSEINDLDKYLSQYWNEITIIVYYRR